MSYGQQNPYASDPQAGYQAPDQGYGAQQYGQQQYGQQYEMQDYNQGGNGAGYQPLSIGEFLQRKGHIQTLLSQLDQQIEAIDREFKANLYSTSNNGSDYLNQLNAQTEEINRNISDEFKFLLKDAKYSTTDLSTKETQINNLRPQFTAKHRAYTEMKAEHRRVYNQQIKRQLDIVAPDATPEEIERAMDGDLSGGVFQQALSNRPGQARAALGNVQSRHQDLQQIERKMAELSEMFRDLAILVEQQDEAITHTEETGHKVVQDLEQGNQQIHKGIEHARFTRKQKWWCLGIVVVICIIIAIVLAIIFRKGGPANP